MTHRTIARTRLSSVLVAAAIAIAARQAAADTYTRQPGVKIAHYTFDVTLNDTNNEFLVNETVDVRFLADGVTGIDLDLCKFTAQPRAPQGADQLRDPCAETSGGRGVAAETPTGGKGMIVTAVTSGGRALSFQHEHDRLHVTFPGPSHAGEQYEFGLSYHGVPATGILIATNKYGDREVFSNPWPNKARNYLASLDHPSAKAPVTTIVTAPRRYQVIANGRMTEQTDLPGDLRRTAWSEANPICTCLMSMGVAPFAVAHFGEYHGIPLSAWVYPQEKDISIPAFSAYTQPILEFFIDHIGPYSYEKLAQVEANGIGGGMELASSIFYGYNATAGPGRQLIAHEMAHQWFGDSAAEKDWDDVWLSEGFATYFALLYQEFEDGHDAFLDGVKRSKAQAVNYALANPTSTIVHENLADFSRVIANNAQIYQGGAQVLQNIRGILGTDTFWTGIRLYYSRFQNGNATSDDLRHAMEDACVAAGDRCPADGKDLAWLFHELLNRGGVLQVQGSWHYDASAKQVQVTLDQTQTSGLYQMPIEVAITALRAPAAGGRGAGTPPPMGVPAAGRANGQGGAGRGAAAQGTPPAPQPVETVAIVPLKEQHQVFTFPCDTEPISVTLDPNAWVMMRATFEKK